MNYFVRMVSMIAIVLLASCKNSNQQNLTGMIGSEEDLIAEKTDRIDCIDNNTRELLLNPQENLRIVCLVNPTMYYHAEHYFMIWLLENMAKTGRYSNIYLDIPALLGMAYDDYIKGKNNVSLDDVAQFYAYDQMLYMTHDDVLRFLSCLKGINATLKQKVSIKGLNYGFDETLYPLAKIYGKQRVLIEKLTKMTTGMSDEQSIRNANKDFNNFLIKNESLLRKDINDGYDIFKRISDLMQIHQSKNLTRKSEQELILFDNFSYLYAKQKEGERSIIYLGPFQMRKEPMITSFRTLLEDKLPQEQYIVYNYLDDDNHERIISCETNPALMVDYDCYLRSRNDTRVME